MLRFSRRRKRIQSSAMVVPSAARAAAKGLFHIRRGVSSLRSLVVLPMSLSGSLLLPAASVR